MLVHMRVNTRVNVAVSQAAQKVSISERGDDPQGARARVLVIGTQFSAASGDPVVHRCGACESYSRNSIPYPYWPYRASVCMHVYIYVDMYVRIMHACMHVSVMHACMYVCQHSRDGGKVPCVITVTAIFLDYIAHAAAAQTPHKPCG
jgi:hypothetical protein